VGFAARLRGVFQGGMLGLIRKEKIKINSDVSRAEMPAFIALLMPHAWQI
jgi:hypothetical protein